MQSLLIIKGYGNHHENRFTELEAQYAYHDCNMHVEFPRVIDTMNDGDTPILATCRQVIIDLLHQRGFDPQELTVLAHSLGGNVWLHVIEECIEYKDCISRLVGTPLKNRTIYPEINPFLEPPDLALTHQQRRNMLVIGSDRDPIIDEPPWKLGIHHQVSHSLVHGAGHFMPKELHDPKSKRKYMDCGPDWKRIRRPYAKMPY